MVGDRGLQAACMALLLGLGACSTTPVQPAYDAAAQYRSAADPAAYRAPGPAEDPWGPYVREAAGRFAIPDSWVRAVMHQESGGHQYLHGQLTTSSAGAMGLMQLMPATYADLQSQYGLGDDPYNPHDNIMAGAGYIRQMYDRYGSPGFLAAYNAGPQRVDDYLSSGRALPDETVNYVAAISPHLGDSVASGVPSRGRVVVASATPTVAYGTAAGAGDGGVNDYARTDLTRTADGCLRNADAAYDPSTPCLMDRDTPHPDPEPVSQPVQQVAMADMPAITPVRTLGQAAAFRPVSLSSAVTGTVQVGAFASYAEAQSTLDSVRGLLAAHALKVRPAVRQASVSGRQFYRAQFETAQDTGPADVCLVLRARSLPCIQVRGG